MMDLDTFLTTLYVIVDDFCQSEPEPENPRLGPLASRGDHVGPVWTMGAIFE